MRSQLICAGFLRLCWNIATGASGGAPDLPEAVAQTATGRGDRRASG